MSPPPKTKDDADTQEVQVPAPTPEQLANLFTVEAVAQEDISVDERSAAVNVTVTPSPVFPDGYTTTGLITLTLDSSHLPDHVTINGSQKGQVIEVTDPSVLKRDKKRDAKGKPVKVDGEPVYESSGEVALSLKVATGLFAALKPGGPAIGSSDLPSNPSAAVVKKSIPLTATAQIIRIDNVPWDCRQTVADKVVLDIKD